MQASKNILDELKFVVIDLETTGGSHESDKIIEIGMVKINGMQIGESKSILIDPEKDIPDFIQKLTSIRTKDVKGKPKIEEVIQEIINFIGDDIIVAHNTSFDVPFLNSVLRRLGRPELKNNVICTNVMTKHMIPEIMASNLAYMSQLFNITHSKAHRAHDDALASARLLIKYLEIFCEKGIQKINQLYYPKNKFELDRINYKFSDPHEEIINKIKNIEIPMSIAIKGERGLILGILPLKNPSKEIEAAALLLENGQWEVATLKLHGTFLEALFECNNHIGKFVPEIKQNILNYLEKTYRPDHNASPLNINYLVSHHLVGEQVMAYSFLHLNTNARHVFKIPSHQKKLLQNINTQFKRFNENNLNKKHTTLSKEMLPFCEQEISKGINEKNYLIVNDTDLLDQGKIFIERLTHFCQNRSIMFPDNHL